MFAFLQLRKAIEEMEAGQLPKSKSRAGGLNEDIQEEDEEVEDEEEDVGPPESAPNDDRENGVSAVERIHQRVLNRSLQR